MSKVQTYAELDPNKIESSKGWNPRTQFEKEALDQLTADIEANGIIEPLIVRKVASLESKCPYQVLAGERRLRAAKKLKLKTVPAIVRQIGDEDAYQLTVSENLNRVDLHAIEEARAFAVQRDRYKVPLKEIARRSGRSLPYVVNRLQLATLSREVCETAFEVGDKLPLGHLMAIAQIGDARAQREFLNKILHPPYSHNGSIMDYEAVKRELAHYQRPLSEAQFTDTPGLTSAPVCKECPQNTSNLPREVFPRKELCTNVDCFAQKQKAYLVQLTTKGTYQPLKATFSSYDNGAPNGYVELAQTYYSGTSSRTYESWFKEFKGEYTPPKYAIFNPNSKRIVFVVGRDQANKAVATITRKLQGKKPKKSATSSTSYTTQRDTNEDKATLRAFESLSSVIGNDWLGEEPARFHRAAVLLFEALTQEMMVADGGIEKIAARRGIELTDAEKKKVGQYGQDDVLVKRLRAWLEARTFNEQFVLCLELSAWSIPNFRYGANQFQASTLGTLYGFDFNEQVKAHKKLLVEEQKDSKKKPAAASAAGA